MSSKFVEVAGDDGRVQQVPIENTAGFKNGDDSRDVRRLARSENGKRASAFATADLVASLAMGGTPLMRENAARVLSELDIPEEATVSNTEIFLPAGVEPPAPVETFEEPVQVVATDYTLPDELVSLLDEDDEVEEPEPVAFEEPESDEYVDPQVAQLRKQLADANKKAQHERKLRVQSSRKDWEAEALRVFKLGEVALITPDDLAKVKAESKKDFFRQVKEKAEERKPFVVSLLPAAAQPKPEPTDVDALVEQRARQLEAERWGNPAGGGGSVPGESLVQQERLTRARRNGNLAALIKARIYPE